MTTDPERIFHEALDRPEYERGEYVARVCGENSTLAREVESLLLQYDQQQPTQLAGRTVAADLLSAAAAGGEIAPGDMLGPYRIERKVGEGGMGTVYSAIDTRLARQVAIKLVRRTLGDDAAALARFRQEARSAAALAHPNIAVLHDFGESDGAPWLVMEFVTGSSLRSRLTAGPLSETTLLRYAGQLAAALEHAHSRGIIHRDIKPENIMIAADGTLKIIDFGIASIVRPANEPATPGAGFLGTAFYAAPEVFSGAMETECCDVYSFGVVAYEMACGTLPYSQPDFMALYAAILRGDYIRAGVRNPLLPSGLAAFIDRCLAPDPAARYRNGTRLAAALRSFTNSANLPRDSSQDIPDSVAIIDFANIVADAALDWLGTGIAETLASRLAKLRSVRVTSRAAVRQAAARLASTAADPSAIGRDVDARWVVAGSFQRMGDSMRVTPQLVESSTGNVLSTDTVDGRWEDLFHLQDRIAALLLQTLAQAQGESDSQPSLAPDTRNLMAYEQYTKGRQNMPQMRSGAITAAIEHFEQAVALDPDYALAYSGLGASCAMQFLRTSNPEDLTRASTYLERATALDAELGEPYLWLCYLRSRYNDPAGALAAGRKAVQLQPDLAEAHYMYGSFHYMWAESRLSDFSLGVNTLAEAIRLQPRIHAAWVLLGASAAWCGQHEQAVRILSEAARMEAQPDLLYRFVGARTLRATAWMRSGRWAQAREGFQEAFRVLQTEPENHYRECFLALCACGLGDIAMRTADAPSALTHYRNAWRIGKETPRMVGSPRLLIRAGAGMAAAYAATGDHGRAKELAQDAAGQLEKVSGQFSSMTIECGLAQLQLSVAVAMLRTGDLAAAAANLQRANESGWRDLEWLLIDPELRPLHGHAAYVSFVERLRLLPPIMVPTSIFMSVS